MKFFYLIAILALAEASIRPTSAVQADPVILDNQTGLSICELHYSPAGANNWSRGYLGGRCLEPERKLKLRLGPSSLNGNQDLHIIFEKGGGRTYFGLDLDRYTYVVLGEMEAELIEWDPSGRPGQ